MGSCVSLDSTEALTSLILDYFKRILYDKKPLSTVIVSLSEIEEPCL